VLLCTKQTGRIVAPIGNENDLRAGESYEVIKDAQQPLSTT